MQPADVLALDIEGATKVFRKKSPRQWPWRRAEQNAGEKPEGDDRRVVDGKLRALDDVSLQVSRGEIYGILGSNGSGKSTLIRLISTLLIPDEGSLRVFGHDVERDEMAVKRMINRVSVEASFFKKLSPMENLLFGARLYGLDAGTARRDAAEILTRLGLKKSVFNSPMEEMSRGMQQKVAIARALLTQPILLLLDEPTTGLDPRSKREVQAFVRELQATHDATVLLTTHDMAEAEALCGRVAIIDEGRIVAQGTPLELKARVAAKGQPADSLEDVFMALTGHEMEEDGSVVKDEAADTTGADAVEPDKEVAHGTSAA